MNEDISRIVAEMRAWANGEGCFNDAPDGETFPCVYYSQSSFLELCDELEAAAQQPSNAVLVGLVAKWRNDAALNPIAPHDAFGRWNEATERCAKELEQAISTKTEAQG